MGFLETLYGQTKILEFKIIFDQFDNVGVRENVFVPKVQSPDYIRLWACYQAKMIYNLGYPNNISSNMAIEALSKIVNNGIEKETDCFYEADFNDVITYSPHIEVGDIVFSGEYYSKGKSERRIKTWLPINGTEQQAVYSALALMQYTIYKIGDQDDVIDVFFKTANNMIELYKTDIGVGIESVIKVPSFSYLKAIDVI